MYDYWDLIKKYKDLQQENKQLKDLLNKANDEVVSYTNCCIDLQQIIDKAIEYIVKNCILSDEWTDLDFCNFIPTGKITYRQLTPKKVKELLGILGDKE